MSDGVPILSRPQPSKYDRFFERGLGGLGGFVRSDPFYPLYPLHPRSKNCGGVFLDNSTSSGKSHNNTNAQQLFVIAHNMC